MPQPTWPATEPIEVTVTSGAADLTVDLRGGGLRRLTVGAWDVLDGYEPGAVPSGRRGGVLIPWPNRIRDGRWTWQGRQLQLDITSTRKPAAIHGLVSSQPWQVLDATAD